MKSEKKLFLSPKDTMDRIWKSYLGKTKADRITLNIPRKSLISESLENFHALQVWAKKEKREIIIESIDEKIIEFAILAGLKAENPIFKGKERIVTDIVPRKDIEKKTVEAYTKADNPVKSSFLGLWKKQDQKKAEEEPEEDEEDEDPVAVVSEIINKKNNKEEDKEDEEEDEEIEEDEEEEDEEEENSYTRKRRTINWKRIMVICVVLFVLGATAWQVCAKVLPKATVTLSLKKYPVTISETIEVRSDTATTYIEGNGKVLLPGELVKVKKNLEMRFKASGKETVNAKAKGLLTLWNAYSSDLQVLVPTTRFEAPDGKIYRLDERVIVPGAKVVDGKMSQSKIEVAVTAEEPGEAYNKGASEEKWHIPGFKDNPKYEGFYATPQKGMQGGFIGERLTPTEDDIAKGKAEVEKNIKLALESQIGVLTKNKFKILEGATEVTVLKSEVNRNVDKDGKFGIFEDAEMKQMVFDEKMLEKGLTDKAKRTITSAPELVIQKFEASYGFVKAELAKGKMQFEAKGSAIFMPKVDPIALTDQVKGKDETALRSIVFAIKGLERATISLWPFWVKTVPENTNKISIILN